MNEFLQNSVFFGVFISIVTYEIGVLIKQKWKMAIFNPLLISIALIIIFLLVFHVDYETYEAGAKYLSYLLTPATVALAVPLYEQIEPLRKNWKAIMAGILAGALTSATCVLVLSVLFGLNHQQYVTLLPKSITTAIGMGLSEELGGIVTFPYYESSCEGNRNWFGIPCDGNCKGDGDGGSRRCNEQSVHCGIWFTYGFGIAFVCADLLI